MKQDIRIYTKDYCFFCNALKGLLNEQGIAYTEIEVSDKPDIHRQIIEETGHRTVPAVFIDGEFLGGSEEFYAWYQQNSVKHANV